MLEALSSDQDVIESNDYSATGSEDDVESDTSEDMKPAPFQIGWNSLGDVSNTIDILLSCGAHATAVHNDRSAAYMALEWCRYKYQTHAILPFIRREVLILDDAIDLFKDIVAIYLGSYRPNQSIDPDVQLKHVNKLQWVAQYLKGTAAALPSYFKKEKSTPPPYLRDIVHELLSNSTRLASTSEQLSRMVSIAQTLAIGGNLSFSEERTGDRFSTTVTDADFPQTLQLAVANDMHSVVAELIADPRFHEERPEGMVFGSAHRTIVGLAADESSENVMKLLLEKGFSVNCRDEYGLTPLHLCSDERSIPVLKLLLGANADSTKEDCNGNTIWHLAAKSKNSLPVLETLIQFDNQKDLALKQTSTCNQRCTPIAEALRFRRKENAERLLIECPNDPAYLASDISVLWYAAAIGSIRLFQKLLEKGVDAHEVGPRNGTPLHNVSLNVEPGFIKYLTSLYDIHQRSWNGSFAITRILWTIDRSAWIDTSQISDVINEMGLLIDDQIKKKMCDEDETIWQCFSNVFLLSAYKFSSTFGNRVVCDLATVLIENGALSNHEDHTGSSAVIPVLNSLLPLTDFGTPWVKEIIKLALNTTTQLESFKAHPFSSKLLIMMCDLDTDYLRYLLDIGIDPLTSHSNQESALEWACSSSLSTATFIMIAIRVDVSRMNSMLIPGHTIIHRLLDANSRNKISKLDYLLISGMNPNVIGGAPLYEPAIVSAALGDRFDFVTKLLENGGSIDAKNVNGDNILLGAAFHGNLGVIQRIHDVVKSDHDWLQTFQYPVPYELESLLATDRFNYLHYASMSGSTNVVEYFMVENLVGVNTISQKQALTALHLAVQGQHRKMAEVLINNGANINAKDSYGNIPLDYALSRGNIEITRLLLLNGSDTGTSSNWTESQIKELMAYTDPELTNTSLKHARLFLEAAILEDDLEKCLDIVETSGIQLDTITMPSCNTCTPLVYAVIMSSNPDVLRWLLSK